MTTALMKGVLIGGLFLPLIVTIAGFLLTIVMTSALLVPVTVSKPVLLLNVASKNRRCSKPSITTGSLLVLVETRKPVNDNCPRQEVRPENLRRKAFRCNGK